MSSCSPIAAEPASICGSAGYFCALPSPLNKGLTQAYDGLMKSFRSPSITELAKFSVVDMKLPASNGIWLIQDPDEV